VPLSIQRHELAPKLLEDKSFLTANHLEVIDQNGRVLEARVSEETIERLREGSLRLRQTPGPKNVLGLVKFEFPNRYEVYIHGTSAPWLFARPRRDLSHGCIRVEDAAALANWVLREEEAWPTERIAAAMHGTQQIAVKLHRPVALVITYVTATVAESGEVRFFEDIYNEDAVNEKEFAVRSPGLKTAGRIGSTVSRTSLHE
jgi:murein L,D-transpeptidase YcbB/YkuD